MRVITRDQVKVQLGIMDNSLDTQIDSKLPIIDAKVKQITRNKFNMQMSAQLTTGSNMATVATINNLNIQTQIEDITEYIMTGDQLEGDGIDTNTSIDDMYYNGSTVTISGTQYTIPAIKLSNVAIESGLKDIFVGFNIGYHDVIAKGVQFLITGTSTSLPQNRLKSKSLPPLSVTYADSKINKTYGMPDWFVDALPTYMSGH